ncbi:hypothetical protein ACTFIW_007143 [Dictyostelium discoideum]
MKSSKIHNCEVCDKIYEEPQSLSCGDTICKKCVEKEKSQQQNKPNFNCPLCKEEVSCHFLNKRMNSEVIEFKKSQCKIHPNEKIISYCDNCNCNICKECSTSSNHRGHIFSTMNESKFELIFNEFSNNQYQKLLEYKQQVANSSELLKENFKRTNDHSSIQLGLLESTFSQLHSTLKTLETQLDFQIKKTNELNQISNTKFTTLITDVESNINNIINKNDQYFSKENSEQYKSTTPGTSDKIKQLFETNQIAIINDLTDTNNLLNNKSNINSNDFIKSSLIINNDNLLKFNEFLNSIFKIENIQQQSQQSQQAQQAQQTQQAQQVQQAQQAQQAQQTQQQQNIISHDNSRTISKSSSMDLNNNNNDDTNSNSSNSSAVSTPSNLPLSKSQSVNNIVKLGNSRSEYTPSITKSTSNSSIKSSNSDEISSTLQQFPSTIISSIPSPNRISKMYSSTNNLSGTVAAKDNTADIFRWNIVDPIPPNTTSICVISTKAQIPAGSIPKKVTSIVFSGYNQPLEEGSIPDTVLNLHLGQDYHQELKENVLPSSITSLHLGGKFNKPLKPGMIPFGVLDLHIGDSFNQSLSSNSLPSSILSLHLGGHFNQKLKQGDIPSSVSKLNLSNDFNQQISQDVIPASCKTLIFGYAFNQVILPGVLPPNIDVLELSYSFNQVLVKGSIPDVRKLTFGYFFNKPIKSDGIIPKSVTHLTYGSLFNQTLTKYVVPKSTTLLTLPDTYASGRTSEISNLSSTCLVSYKPRDY